MAIRGIYRKVWENPDVKNAKISQDDVTTVLNAFKDYFYQEMTEKLEFKWKGVFSTKAIRMDGYVQFPKDSDPIEIEPFYKLYIKASDTLKREMKEKQCKGGN